MRVGRASSLTVRRKSNGIVLVRGAEPTGACHRLRKVGKVDICCEVCLAGALKRVRERVTLKGL